MEFELEQDLFRRLSRHSWQGLGALSLCMGWPVGFTSVKENFWDFSSSHVLVTETQASWGDGRGS